NNLITQIGFIVLIGLAAKNAVLIVEFAKQRQDEGQDRFTAAVQAAGLRLRPILMTSFAFILGVLPLAVGSGPGAEMRQAPGTTRGQHGPADPASLADLPWWAVFRDPALHTLVQEAIRGNHDLRAAAARVEQARNRIAVARADMFPQVGYEGEAARQRVSI